VSTLHAAGAFVTLWLAALPSPLLACAAGSKPQLNAARLSPEQPAKESPVTRPTSAVPPELEKPVQQARKDLARRLGVDEALVEFVEAREVVWPDASLGCPRPGMAYIQVPRDGLLVRLAVAGEVYEYHSGDGRPPFLCEHPAPGGTGAGPR